LRCWIRKRGKYYFMAAMLHENFIDRAIGELTEDLFALIDQHDEVLFFSHRFRDTITADINPRKLYMYQLTDSEKWFSLVNRDRDVRTYLEGLIVHPAHTWKIEKQINAIEKDEWISEDDSKWVLSGDTIARVTDHNEILFMTYGRRVEQVKKDVRISFTVDVSRNVGAMGVVFFADISRSFTATSYPDANGHYFALEFWGENQEVFRLKRHGKDIEFKQVGSRRSIAEMLKTFAPGKKRIVITFEKVGHAFTCLVEDKPIVSLFDVGQALQNVSSYIGLVGGANANFSAISVFTRSTLFDPGKIPSQSVDLQFYRLPNRTYETRIGKPLHMGNEIQYVYMKDVTRSRQLLDQVNSYIKKIDEELDTAKRIQNALANIPVPQSTRIDFSYFYKPSGKVGGDMLDIKEVGDGRYAVVVFDVAGHGIAASLISSMVKMSFTTALKQTQSPAEVIRIVNHDMCTATESTTLVTAFVGIIDLAAGTLAYSRAGHCMPAIFSQGEKAPLVLEGGSLMMGIYENYSIQEFSAPLRNGDRILLYTDGITELRNGKNEFFGINRLHGLVSETLALTLDEAKQRIVTEAVSFMAGSPFHDDVTLLLIDVKRVGA